MEKERNYGIDLLRLVFMFMVCLYHTLGRGGILKASSGTEGYKVFWLLEIISCCAVDGFAVISGYMASARPHKYFKIVEMWFQAFFYSFVVTLVFIGNRMSEFLMEGGMSELIKCAMPVTFGKFWYFTAYFALFFVMPILSKFIFEIDNITAQKSFVVILTLFSGMGIINDTFDLQWGYSALWLIVLYCIGALAKRIRLFEMKKSIYLIAIWFFDIISMWILRVYVGSGRLINYTSPTVLLSAILMVMLFSRMRLKNTMKKVVARLSPFAFGIYLFQYNPVIWNNILADRFEFVVSKNVILGVIYTLMFALAIWISGIIMEFIRNFIAKLLRISLISKKITEIANQSIEKVFVLLK